MSLIVVCLLPKQNQDDGALKQIISDKEKYSTLSLFFVVDFLLYLIV
jgi:hypothetical protein